MGLRRSLRLSAAELNSEINGDRAEVEKLDLSEMAMWL